MTPLYARHKRTTLAIATAVAAGLLTTGLTTALRGERAVRRQGQGLRRPRDAVPGHAHGSHQVRQADAPAAAAETWARRQGEADRP